MQFWRLKTVITHFIYVNLGIINLHIELNSFQAQKYEQKLLT